MDLYVLRVKESEYHKKEPFETFFVTLIVKDDFKPTFVMYILYHLCTFVMSIRNTYMNNIHNCIVYMLIIILILSL